MSVREVALEKSHQDLERREKVLKEQMARYQKVIEETENVILCVAKAEMMVRQLGRSLVERQRESPEQIAAPFDMEGTDNE